MVNTQGKVKVAVGRIAEGRVPIDVHELAVTEFIQITSIFIVTTLNCFLMKYPLVPPEWAGTMPVIIVSMAETRKSQITISRDLFTCQYLCLLRIVHASGDGAGDIGKKRGE